MLAADTEAERVLYLIEARAEQQIRLFHRLELVADETVEQYGLLQAFLLLSDDLLLRGLKLLKQLPLDRLAVLRLHCIVVDAVYHFARALQVQCLDIID